MGLAAVPLSLLLPIQVVGAATEHNAQIRFDDPGRVVTLTIPTPGCREDNHAIACRWELYVNEPFVPGQPVVGVASGTSGVLSVEYPSFCGVIQADAIIGPPPNLVVGHRHQINTCGCPSSSKIGLTSLITRPLTPGTAGPDQLALFLGLVVVAGALGRRRATHLR